LKRVSAWQNHTFLIQNILWRIIYTLVSVKITLCLSLPHFWMLKSYSCYQYHTMRVIITPLRVNITLYVSKLIFFKSWSYLTSHYHTREWLARAFQNQSRDCWKKKLRFETKLKLSKIIFFAVKITLCLSKFFFCKQ
jgi:hypothetical protein